MTLRRLLISERRLETTASTESPARTLQPIDLTLTKKVLRFTPTTEDVVIEGWLVAANEYFKDQTSRETVASLWELSMDALPVGGLIELPHPPLLSVESITVGGVDVDADIYTILSPAVGSPATVTDPFVPRAQIALNDGASWPTFTAQAGTVVIRFWAGYGYTQEDIPEIVKACLYDLVRHFHSRPDGDLPMTTQVMLRMFRQSAISQVAMEREWLG